MALFEMSDDNVISDPAMIGRIKPTIIDPRPHSTPNPDPARTTLVDPSRYGQINVAGSQSEAESPSYASQIGTGLAKDAVAPFVSVGEMSMANTRARQKYGAPPSLSPIDLAVRGLNAVPPIHNLAKKAQRWVEGPSSGITEDLTRFAPDLAMLAATRSNAPMVEADIARLGARVFGSNFGRVATKKMVTDLTSHVGAKNVRAAMNVINRMKAPQYLKDMFSRELGREVRTRSVGFAGRMAGRTGVGTAAGAAVSPGHQGAGGAAGGGAAVGAPYTGPLAHAVKRHPYLAGLAGFGGGEHSWHSWSPWRAGAAYGLASALSAARGGAPLGIGALAAQLMNNPDILDITQQGGNQSMFPDTGPPAPDSDEGPEPAPPAEPPAPPEPAPPAIGND